MRYLLLLLLVAGCVTPAGHFPPDASLPGDIDFSPGAVPPPVGTKDRKIYDLVNALMAMERKTIELEGKVKQSYESGAKVAGMLNECQQHGPLLAAKQLEESELVSHRSLSCPSPAPAPVPAPPAICPAATVNYICTVPPCPGPPKPPPPPPWWEDPVKLILAAASGGGGIILTALAQRIVANIKGKTPRKKR